MDNKSNNFIVILGLFIFACVIRVVLNNHNYIINIIGAVNIIAFWYVLYLILDNSKNKFMERIHKLDIIGDITKTKKKKHFIFRLNIAKIIVFILGLVYIFFFANSIVNDIISLAALFLSIETDYVYNVIQDYYFKKK